MKIKLTMVYFLIMSIANSMPGGPGGGGPRPTTDARINSMHEFRFSNRETLNLDNYDFSHSLIKHGSLKLPIGSISNIEWKNTVIDQYDMISIASGLIEDSSIKKINEELLEVSSEASIKVNLISGEELTHEGGSSVQ